MTRRQRAFIGALVATAAAAGALVYMWRYGAPFVLATFLAAVIDPAVGWLSRRLFIGRGIAVLLALAVVLAALVGAIVALAINLSAEMHQLLDALPVYARQLEAAAEQLGQRLESWFAGWPRAIVGGLTIQPEQWTVALHRLTSGALATLGALPQGLFVLFVSVVATYFISKDRHKLWQGVLAAVPVEWRAPLIRLRDEVVGGALGIVKAQCALIGLTAAASVLALSLAGVPYPWALGVLAGVLDLAPFLGPSTVFLPGAALYLWHNETGPALALLVCWMAIVVGRQVVEPHLLGKGLGLHPVTALAALYVGIRVFGAAGVVTGPLLFVAAKALFVVVAPGSGPRL